jgi:hypothetical protein
MKLLTPAGFSWQLALERTDLGIHDSGIIILI